MKEYIVTLHNREDLEDFYNDMETPGGDLYIPDRAVDLQLRRAISRNTHYMLTFEEAEQLKEDPRVWDVTSKDLLDAIEWKSEGYTESGTWRRAGLAFPQDNENNWGLYRHTQTANPGGNWGSDDVADKTASFTITASGKNVDVLIVDGSITTTAGNHPEFAVNPDGTGGTRVQYFNWFSLTNQLGLGFNGTYDYSTIGSASDTNHGCHVAGTVAGNTLGWARDANIYSLEFDYFGSVNYGPLSMSTMWDYIREWHNTKPINPDTGRRNPTISNHSYGSTFTKDSLVTSNPNYDGIGAIRYRGVILDEYNTNGNDVSDAQLEARGVNVPADSNFTISAYTTDYVADVQDAISDGIIIVTSAGNHSQKNVLFGDQDYDNILYLRADSNYTAIVYSNRGGQSAGKNVSQALVVGNLYDESDDKKDPGSVCGNIVDVFAAGYGIMSSVLTGSRADLRDSNFYLSKYGGSSMASPQVAGVLALFAESNPNLTMSEAHDFITNTATPNIMYDTGTDDCTDFESLQGAANKILYWKNQRPETGLSFPKINAKVRPSSGRTWPRPRMRVKG